MNDFRSNAIRPTVLAPSMWALQSGFRILVIVVNHS
jgi:hypothetical protein